MTKNMFFKDLPFHVGCELMHVLAFSLSIGIFPSIQLSFNGRVYSIVPTKVRSPRFKLTGGTATGPIRSSSEIAPPITARHERRRPITDRRTSSRLVVHPSIATSDISPSFTKHYISTFPRSAPYEVLYSKEDDPVALYDPATKHPCDGQIIAL